MVTPLPSSLSRCRHAKPCLLAGEAYCFFLRWTKVRGAEKKASFHTSRHVHTPRFLARKEWGGKSGVKRERRGKTNMHEKKSCRSPCSSHGPASPALEEATVAKADRCHQPCSPCVLTAKRWLSLSLTLFSDPSRSLAQASELSTSRLDSQRSAGRPRRCCRAAGTACGPWPGWLVERSLDRPQNRHVDMANAVVSISYAVAIQRLAGRRPDR